MQVVFRADASVTMGSGHIMRCLTLADALHEQGVDITFICRELPGNMCKFIEKKGYEVYRLPYNAQGVNSSVNEQTLWLGETWQADTEQTKQVLQKMNIVATINWLIVDHYSLDRQWEEQMKLYVQKIMVIDDLANRHHDCDLLLDQNLYFNMQTRYDRLIPMQCQRLLGPQYAILRTEFNQARQSAKIRDGIVKRILIFFGGSDPTNETTKALEAIQLLHRNDIYIDVVVGAINPHKEQIKKLCNEIPNTIFYCQINNIAELMVKADLAIGAGGTATWERLCIGLPCLIIAVAANQIEIAQCVDKAMCSIYIDSSINVSSEKLAEVLSKCIYNPNQIKQMSYLGMKIVDDQGTEKISYILKR